MNNIHLPVPTAATLLSRALCTAGSVIYITLFAVCILYLLWWIVIELRDWFRMKIVDKYLKENEPVEYILDYPGYAIEEYRNDNKDSE